MVSLHGPGKWREEPLVVSELDCVQLVGLAVDLFHLVQDQLGIWESEKRKISLSPIIQRLLIPPQDIRLSNKLASCLKKVRPVFVVMSSALPFLASPTFS